jgi:hypothetical protein
MKKIAFVILLFSVCNLFAQNNRYDIKSGIVEYDILGTTNSKDHTFSGSSILYFKDFGNLELFDEIITQKRGSIVEEERNTYKISKGKIYTADFNDEIIFFIYFPHHKLAKLYIYTDKFTIYKKRESIFIFYY